MNPWLFHEILQRVGPLIEKSIIPLCLTQLIYIDKLLHNSYPQK